MLNVLERGRLRDHAVLGLVIGMTFAFRGSSLPILAPVALTYAALLWRQWETGERGWPLAQPLVRPAALAFGVALLTFIVLQPYALIDYRKYVADLGWEGMVARTAGSCRTRSSTSAYRATAFYELRQTALWALGLPLGVVAWGGLPPAIIAGLRRPRIGEWLLNLVGRRPSRGHRAALRGEVPTLRGPPRCSCSSCSEATGSWRRTGSRGREGSRGSVSSKR